MKDPRNILITGASSGIGEALAVAYAGPGINLALTGRDAVRLEGVVAACRARGATVQAAIIDAADRETTARWIEELDRTTPIDLVIANAGIGVGAIDAMETEEQTRRVFSVNLDGVLNTVLPLIPKLAARRRGQIALMSSLASFRGFPTSPTYCGSKAALRVWGEGLRGNLQAHSIEVSVICPGFVRSRITDRNEFPMPFLMSAERAAAIVKRGLARNRGRIAFPLPMHLLAWFIAALPTTLTDALLRRR